MAAAPTSASPSAGAGRRQHRLHLMADVGQRHGDADERDRRMPHRHRRVQHVHLDAGARASRPADAVRRARRRLRDAGRGSPSTPGPTSFSNESPTHPSVLGDEGDTRASAARRSESLPPGAPAIVGSVVRRLSSSAASRVSATSVDSIWSSTCRRMVVANSMPATPSARTVAVSAARKNCVWKVARTGVMATIRARAACSRTASR